MFSTRESAACGTHRSVVDTQHFDRIKCLAAEAGVAIQYKLNTLSPAQASCEHSPQLDRMKKNMLCEKYETLNMNCRF